MMVRDSGNHQAAGAPLKDCCQRPAARNVLHRACGEGDIDAEIAEVRELSERNSSFREVLRPAVRHVMIIGVTLAVFQQTTGINTIIYYAPTLLKSAGLGSSAALLANVVNGAVNVAMTIAAIRLVDRTGGARCCWEAPREWRRE